MITRSFSLDDLYSHYAYMYKMCIFETQFEIANIEMKACSTRMRDQ